MSTQDTPNELDELEALAREAERAYDRSVRFGWDDAENRRAILAAVIPEIERRVREQVAARLRKEAEDARRTLAVFEPHDRDTRVLARAATLDEIADRITRGEP